MRPVLEDYGVSLVALSKDTAAQVRLQRERDKLSFTLLSDPELEVIGRYGLVHDGGLEFATFELLGIPLGWPLGRRKMAIPTSILVDEAQRVRWIDQADDYRMRGDAERIIAALARAFPGSQIPRATAREVAGTRSG